MYESPILITVDELHRDFVKKQDDYIFLTVEKALKCEVNREEMLKALAYDRDQYDKGFRDGRAYKPPIETNYDRLVRKSPEELAEFMWIRGCPTAAMCDACIKSSMGKYCKECWLDWLKQEAKE
jgi:hypothetical protein